jgi:hypothetical protein
MARSVMEEGMARLIRVLAAVGVAVLLGCGASSQGTDAAPTGDDATARDADGTHDGQPTDGAPPGGDGPGGDGPACIPAPAPGPSAHNVGQDCLSCHPAFGAAGSIYSDAAGTQTLGAVTVRILDHNGVTHDGVTCGCGNFIVRNSVAFPATLIVSKCPDTAVMVGEITYGGCNSCHAAGNRVHLP